MKYGTVVNEELNLGSSMVHSRRVVATLSVCCVAGNNNIALSTMIQAIIKSLLCCDLLLKNNFKPIKINYEFI